MVLCKIKQEITYIQHMSNNILTQLKSRNHKHLVLKHLKLRTFITVGDSPPFGGRGIPFYLSQFVSILGNLYPDRGIKGSFLGMFGKMDLCKKILMLAYTSLI